MTCPGEYLTPTIGGNKSWAKSDAAQISKREYSKHTHTSKGNSIWPRARGRPAQQSQLTMPKIYIVVLPTLRRKNTREIKF